LPCIGADWLSFWKALQAVKRQGYWTSTGELDTHMSGISAPILFGTGEVAGSMTLVFTVDEFKMYETALLAARLRAAAAQISGDLAANLRHTSKTPALPTPAKPKRAAVRARPAAKTKVPARKKAVARKR